MDDRQTQRDAPAQKDDIVHRTFGIEIRAETLNEERRSVDVVASTASLDSYDEIVAQNWRLERYAKNPVLLYGHNRATGFLGGLTQLETLPIGHAENVRVDAEGLKATLFFVDEKASPLAPYVWESFKQKALRAVSVGFYPHEIREERHGDIDVYVLDDNELFEISPVPLPANADAVALSANSNREQLRRLALRNAESAPQQESNMDPKKLEELQAKLMELEAAAATHTAALTAKDTELTELRAQLTARDASLATATADLATANAELATVAEARKAELRATAKLKMQTIFANRITPAEVDDYAEDYVADPAKTEARIAKRPEHHLGDQIIPQAPITPTTPAAADADSQLAARVAKKAAE